ncbi:TPA: P-loop ATPase, Sll1717 family [Providencia alcalifaciens]
MRPKIREFKIGEVYGENEVQYVDNYSNYFYDLNNSLEKLDKKNKMVVIGRKGTGKTLLANVFCEKKLKDNKIAVVESLKEFVFHELTHFQGMDISSTKYVPIFKWMILVNIAKNIVKNSNGFDKNKVNHLDGFLRSFGHTAGDLRPEATIEITREFQNSGEAGVGFKFPFFHGEAKYKGNEVEKTKEIKRSYLECIESLQYFLIDMLKEKNKEVYIFYDELDDKFDRTVEYKNAMISFLNAVISVNNSLMQNNVVAKIGALIRYDIINTFSSPNINKIIEDNSIILDWSCGKVQASDSDIFEMLVFKIKNSTNYYNKLTCSTLFGDIFAERIAGEHSSIYILHRTLGRPRDAIRMLTLIQDEFGEHAERFEASMFTKLSKKYSSYLLREIRSELIGHISDSEIEDCFSLMRSVKKRGFTQSVIERNYVGLNFGQDALPLNKMLSYLFKAGAICNVLRRAKADGGDVYLWSYNDEDIDVDPSLNYEIHCGLWDALGIIKPKHR